jgi:hypothetical protein
VGSELRLCRPFATLFYLSTLPAVSPSLPSAVGHSSVAVGIGNITKTRKSVNRFLDFFSKKNFQTIYCSKTIPLAPKVKASSSLHSRNNESIFAPLWVKLGPTI